MTILGISAYYHDSAAAIIKDGEIIAAAQEERFSRIKNDSSFPTASIHYCLKEAACTIDELDAVVYYEKPFLKFERLLETYYAFAPKGFISFLKAIPVWIKEKLFIKQNIRKELKKIQAYDKTKLKLFFTEHHLSHSASAYYPSGFSEAAIVTIDGVGELATTTICKGKGKDIEILKEIQFPHSVGLLYSAFTYFLGFKVNSDEYKLMGLAPYGNPHSEQVKKYYDIITQHLITVFDDGSIHLNQQYFAYGYSLRMINEKKFEELFGFAKREPSEDFLQAHLDCAYVIQKITEEIVLKLCKHAKVITGSNNLCLAGGVALNCVANGKILEENIFDRIFIQPAAGDAGGALGAALAGYHIRFKKELLPTTNNTDKMKGSLLGPAFSDTEILNSIETADLAYQRFESIDDLCKHVAQLLAEGAVVGWFQGKMEYGPRALGNRSIIADTRNVEMQKKLNLKIKGRESFRPFAPAVLAKDVFHYFETDSPSPYMLLVHPVKKNLCTAMADDYHEQSWSQKLYAMKSSLPAITHVDFSARIQTVDEITNPIFYTLINYFKQQTGIGMVVNTSFNIKDEPIVCTPADACRCFMKTEMDVLVIGNYILKKQPI
jgi:carbamoyltransferase